jgi:stringent starvation protein B
VSRLNGATGLGVGYAYKTDRDDNLAFTIGVGTSGNEQVGKASVGFEFGGSKKRIEIPVYAAVVVASEPEPVYEEVIEQQRAIAVDHYEDIQQMQAEQSSIEKRLEAVEAKRVADVRRRAAYEAAEEKRKEEDRAYAQQTLSELEQYRK